MNKLVDIEIYNQMRVLIQGFVDVDLNLSCYADLDEMEQEAVKIATEEVLKVYKKTLPV